MDPPRGVLFYGPPGTGKVFSYTCGTALVSNYPWRLLFQSPVANLSFSKLNVILLFFCGFGGGEQTLCARALANECSKAGKHVSFFMRKGADCLSKWTGESERMLRLLFDQAYKMRPSIIFFDEIDGCVRGKGCAMILNFLVATFV